MFLWWSKKKDESVKEAIEEEQHEVDDLKQELNTASLSRPSAVSRAKFSKWAVAEDNRLIGNAMRQEHEGLVTQREETRNEFMEASEKRTQQFRQQREAAAKRVQEHRAAMQERGRQLKGTMSDRQGTLRAAREAYQRYSQDQARIYGAETRERMLERRAEEEESRRLAARNLKFEMMERQQAFKEQHDQLISERRDRVDRIRKETHPDAAVSARQYFIDQRKAIADDVRESVCEWKKETAANFQVALDHAKLNKQDADETRKRVIDGRALLVEQRRQDASEMRDCIKQVRLPCIHAPACESLQAFLSSTRMRLFHASL